MYRSLYKRSLLFLLVLIHGSFNVVPVTSFQSDSQSIYFREDDSAIYIGNDLIEVGFVKDTGALWSILHKYSGVDLRGLKTDTGEGLWDLSLLTEGLEHIGPSGIMRSHRYYDGYSLNQTTNEIEIIFEWAKVWLQDYGEYPLRVIATVKIYQNIGFAYFSLKIENSGSASIEEICYPTIWGVTQLGDEATDDELVLPEQNGRLIHNPSESLEGWTQTYPSGFCTMQFIAYYDKEAGFYLGMHDQDGNIKSFSWVRNVDSARIGFTHYPTIDYGESYVLSYDVLIGVFKGNWYTAADMYKNWAQRQWWAQRKEQRSWLQDVAVGRDFYCYSGEGKRTFNECILKLKQHQEFFSLPTLLNLWGWERKGAWSYGIYFPPIEGWNKFSELVEDAHELDTRVWVHVGATSLIKESELWMNGTAQNYALLKEDGSHFSEKKDWECVFMCPHTDFWKNTLKETVVTLAAYGVDAIQFDEFPSSPPKPCYNASHGHPLGLGGDQYVKSWVSILNETRLAARTVNPDVIFSGEGGAEVFIPFLDFYHSRDSWAEAFDDRVYDEIASVIPLFNYVYNECMIFVGQHDLRLGNHESASYNRLGIARLLVWGEIPCYNMQEDFDDEEVDTQLLDYLRKIGLLRVTYADQFLSYTKPIHIEDLMSPKTLVRLEGLPCVCDEVVEDGCLREYNVSSIQHGAWLAKDDSTAYVFTNIANRNVEIKHQFKTSTPEPNLIFLLRDGKLEWTKLNENELFDLTLTIEPLEIILLMFTPPDMTPPEADAGSDIRIVEDTLVSFNGSASKDDFFIVNYTWTFKELDELIILRGVNPSYNFNNPGTYFVTLNVTDAMKNYDTDTIEIYVMDITEPVAEAGSDRAVKVGENIIFDASQSTDNVKIVSYEWDLGDGTKRTFPIEPHTYMEPGVYEVTLTVKDLAGNLAKDTVTVTVEEKAPEPSGEKYGFLSWVLAGGRWILIVLGISFVLGMIPYLLTRTSKGQKHARSLFSLTRQIFTRWALLIHLYNHFTSSARDLVCDLCLHVISFNNKKI